MKWIQVLAISTLGTLVALGIMEAMRFCLTLWTLKRMMQQEAELTEIVGESLRTVKALNEDLAATLSKHDSQPQR